METDITKRDRFKRLASKRVTEVLKKLEVLGNCSSKSSYLYTEEEVETMFRAIEEKLVTMKSKFKPQAPEDKNFKF